MDRGEVGRGSNGGCCYYSILGIRRDASSSDIRTAYRKLAMIWHPDKWARNPATIGEAKKRFQQIQEAYSVLSDQSKRSMNQHQTAKRGRCSGSSRDNTNNKRTNFVWIGWKPTPVFSISLLHLAVSLYSN